MRSRARRAATPPATAATMRAHLVVGAAGAATSCVNAALVARRREIRTVADDHHHARVRSWATESLEQLARALVDPVHVLDDRGRPARAGSPHHEAGRPRRNVSRFISRSARQPRWGRGRLGERRRSGTGRSLELRANLRPSRRLLHRGVDASSPGRGRSTAQHADERRVGDGVAERRAAALRRRLPARPRAAA